MMKAQRKSFSMLELVFVVVMLGVLAAVSVMYVPQTKLQEAADYMIQNLKLTKSLAQMDDRFYTMDDKSSTSVDTATQARYWQAGMWQMQFHLTGSIAGNSYSVYADVANTADSKVFDGKPMTGDFIARDPDNQACLTGYSKDNRPSDCGNNIAKEVRLEETYGVTIDEVSCTTDRTSHLYFDKDGLPYCGNVSIANNNIVLPQRLTQPFRIVLKRKNATATICVSRGGLIYGANPASGQTTADCTL